jgi:amidohydrolase
MAAVIAAGGLSLGTSTCRTEESMETRVAARASEIRDDLIRIRRDLHQHPELAGQEERTARLVADRLRELGLSVRTGVGGHGVVGLLEGSRPGQVVAYRADMDAVGAPAEEKDYPFKSQVEGVRHACGHDLHVAVGLGIADVLASMREDLPGTVKFLFQPAEETTEGARAMIADDALRDPVPDVIYAIHTAWFRAGRIAYGPGVGLPGFNDFRLTLKEKDASPELADRCRQAIQSVGTATFPETDEEFADFMSELTRQDTSLARFVFVIAFTTGGGSGVAGLIRASRDEDYPAIRDRVRAALDAEGIPRDAYELAFDEPVFPGMFNDAALSEAGAESLAKVVGRESVVRLHASVPFFSEDFALFLERIPGAMFFLGVANPEKGINGIPHHPSFDLDEEALVIGTRAMATVIMDRLRGS